jgi:ankyrin repeat protein
MKHMKGSFVRNIVSAACLAFALSTVLLAGVARSVVDAPVADAAMNGNIAAVRALLKQHTDINVPQGDGTTALHWAAVRGDVELARLLIESGANVNARTRNGDLTPLFMAARNGSAPIIELLLKAGVDPNVADVNGTSALMYAAISGKPEAAGVLLDHGANPDARDITNGQTAMMFAAASGRAAVIEMLASRGADPNVVTKVSEVIKYDERLREKEREDAAKKAAEAAASAPAAPADDKTKQADQKPPAPPPSGRAARPREKILIGGMTALLFAAREGHLDAVHKLVEAGADVNLTSESDHISALVTAIINGHLDVANYLVNHGADTNLATDYGLSPLYAVIDAQWAERTWYPAPTIDEEETHYLDLMKSIIAHGADPNIRLKQKPWYRTEHGDWVNPVGATPFWLAAKADDVEAMKLLLAAGANPSIATNAGTTPLMVAAGYGLEPQVTRFVPNGRLAAVRYLIEQTGADVNAKDKNGYTALHGAGLTAEKDVILYLIAAGGDVTARARQVFGGTGKDDEKLDKETGDTVADMANGPRPHNLQYPEIVDLLVKLGSKNSNNCRASTCVVKTVPEF